MTKLCAWPPDPRGYRAVTARARGYRAQTRGYCAQARGYRAQARSYRAHAHARAALSLLLPSFSYAFQMYHLLT